jgi:hypothetical protein
MRLREFLENRAQIRVKEYERWGDDLIYVGGFYWADNQIIPTDGGFYTLNMDVIAEWKGDNVLTIVRVVK